MIKVILTRGLPASGKTVWAKEQQAKDPNIVLVNKDDLRTMLHNGVWSKDREKFVLAARDYVILKAIQEGHDVIVHDTNLHSKHKNHIWKLVADKATVEIRDFTDVPLEECIKRDQKRPNYVGEKVIRKMYNQFLKLQPPIVQEDPSLPTAIICDIDGTLAQFGDKNPYDRDFSKDILNEPIAAIVTYYMNYYDKRFNSYPLCLLFVSGRKGEYREVTEQWLQRHFGRGRIRNFLIGTPKYELFMRPEKDMRPDAVIKKEIYDAHIKDKYNVLFVLDDRNQVVELWRNLGLTCLQVAEGDF